MPLVPSMSSERIAPRASIGRAASSPPATAGVGGGAGVSIGLAKYTYSYGAGIVVSGGTFVFGENGEVPAASFFTPDTIGLTFHSGATPLTIPPGWMWWAAVYLSVGGIEITPPVDEAFQIQGVAGSDQYSLMGGTADNPAAGTSGYSGIDPQVCNVFTASALQGTSFTVMGIVLNMMAIQQRSVVAGQIPS